MASIETLLGLVNSGESSALTDAELLERFKGCFDLERKLIADGDLKVIKDPPSNLEEDESPAKKPRSSAIEKKRAKIEEQKAQLLELAKLLEPTT